MAPVVVASLFAVICFCALMLVIFKGPLVVGDLRIQQREKAIMTILGALEVQKPEGCVVRTEC